jgi:hypothetical protein
METPAAQSETAQRRIALQHAEIQTDATSVRRTAQFTDGSRGAVTMHWTDVTRVAAFQRDVVTHPVACVAVSVPGNVVVLDESMHGWQSLLEGLSAHIIGSARFAAWSASVARQESDAHWTVLFPVG